MYQVFLPEMLTQASYKHTFTSLRYVVVHNSGFGTRVMCVYIPVCAANTTKLKYMYKHIVCCLGL